MASVCSLLSYGCETRQLNEQMMRKLNVANSIMLSCITDNDIRFETHATTSSYNLVRQIRWHRFNWLGQILRSDSSRIDPGATCQPHHWRPPYGRTPPPRYQQSHPTSCGQARDTGSLSVMGSLRLFIWCMYLFLLPATMRNENWEPKYHFIINLMIIIYLSSVRRAK